jgi:Polyketide cyclase / dehydrase and lipid transport
MSEERYPYEIESHWRVLGAIDDVYAVLTDAEALPRWWPEAYSRITVAAEGAEDGVGRITDITTRGVPYDVTWRVEVTEARRPELIRVRASGDVIGLGTWQLSEDDGAVDLSYLWRVRVGKPWMQKVEFLLKPVFAWNHNWVMRRGELGLRAELSRRAVRPPA